MDPRLTIGIQQRHDGSCQVSGPRGSGDVGPLMISTFFSGIGGQREARPLRERRARPQRT